MSLSPREVVEAPAREWRCYPEYRDSGVEWLGEVPDHWDLKPIRYLFAIVGGSTPASGVPDYWDGEVPWVTPEDLGQLEGDTLTATRRQLTRAGYLSCGTMMVPSGSLIMSTRAPIGHIAIAGVDLCTNQGCKALVSVRAEESRFFYYQCIAARHAIRSWGQGSTFQELGRNKLGSILLLRPPVREQTCIAAFLDRETQKIDGLIARRKRLIGLLEEKKTALISRAVTKGLDPDVPMKDSGMEWLGEIPEHWELRPLKYQTLFINGAPFKPSDWVDEGVPIIRIENLNGGGSFNYSAREVDNRYHVHEGDLLFAWSGNRGTSFGPFIWQREGLYYLNQHIFRLTGFQQDKLWFYWMLMGVTAYVEKQAHGIIGLVHITKQDLGSIKVPVVPYEEQCSIAAYVNHEMAKIDALIGKVREHTEKLREYRTALISAAVTGKIDVRQEL